MGFEVLSKYFLVLEQMWLLNNMSLLKSVGGRIANWLPNVTWWWWWPSSQPTFPHLYFFVPLNHSFVFLKYVPFCQLTCVADRAGSSQVFDSDWNLPDSQRGWNWDQETPSSLPTSLLADKIPEGERKSTLFLKNKQARNRESRITQCAP